MGAAQSLLYMSARLEALRGASQAHRTEPDSRTDFKTGVAPYLILPIAKGARQISPQTSELLCVRCLPGHVPEVNVALLLIFTSGTDSFESEAH